MQHLVLLHPGQELVLSLERKGPDRAIVEVAGSLLKVTNSTHESHKEKFHIRPIDDYTEWSKYSACFLGEIWIENQESLSKLVVVQDCRNKEKRSHLTVMNPDCYDVRVHPHHIIEVILYDEGFSYQDEWNWNWSSLKNLDLEIVGRDVLSLFYLQGQYQDNPSLQYAMCPRIETEELCRQHHLWFRFGKQIMSLIKEESDVVHVGNLSFDGRSSKFIPNSPRRQMHLSLYVDFRKTKIGRLMNTLSHEKKSAHDITYAQNKYPRKGSLVKKKPDLLTVKEVSITKIDEKSLHHGCKVLSAAPTEEKGATQMMYDEYDEFLLAQDHRAQPHWWGNKTHGTYWKKRWD